MALWPISSTTIIAVSWSSTWLIVTIVPIFIIVLMTSAAFTDILCARSATEIVSGTMISRTSGPDAPRQRVAAFFVAMAPADFGGASPRPTRRRIAAQLERAAPRSFFLEHLAGRLLGGLVPLFARLRGRAMQRAFGGRLRLGGGGRLGSRGGLGSSLGGDSGCGFRFRGRLRRGFFGIAFLLGLARRLALLLFLDLLLLALLQRLALARFLLAHAISAADNSFRRPDDAAPAPRLPGPELRRRAPRE